MKDKNVIVSQELGEISSVESGQMNCLIVYPDRKHVKYIHQITNSLEEILKELDFSVNKLSDETFPDEHFGETFEFLAKDCDLAVVIFDGFRPNVLFEYGYLRGLKKIILPIKSKMASVAVKSLYRIKENADTREIQDHTGLTKAQFCHLKEPPLGYFSLLSDRYGINIIEVDCNAELSSKNHPKTKLKTEIEKLMPRIINSYTKTSFNATTLTNPNLVKQSEKIITKLLQYSARIVSFESSDIKNILKEINTLEQETNNNVPSEVYQTASSLFKTLTKQTQVYDASLIVEYSNEAIRMLEKSLNIKQDPTKRAKILTDIGTQYVEFSRITDNEEELLKQAIKSFDEALGIFTKEKHPKAYAKARHNLGFAYSNLSDIRNQDKNLKEAIRAFQDTLTVYRKEKFPIDYGRTQNNLGGAFLRLAEISNKEEDLKKAIEAYEEALSVYKKKEYPIQYANAKNNIGTAYGKLLKKEVHEKYFSQALTSFREALTMFKKEKNPNEYLAVQNNLGNLYSKLAEFANKEENLRKAIRIYRKILPIRKKKGNPTNYAMTQYNLGGAFFRLAMISNKEEDLKKAIEAYEEALAVYTVEKYPLHYASIQEALKKIAVQSVFLNLLSDLK